MSRRSRARPSVDLARAALPDLSHDSPPPDLEESKTSAVRNRYPMRRDCRDFAGRAPARSDRVDGD